MTILDWAIVAFTIAFAMWGYRQGLIVGVLTLLGFVAGAVAGSRAGPLLLSEGPSSPYAPLFAALGALLAGALVAVTVESLALELRERLVRGHVLRLADGTGGAALIAAVALGLIWVFGAVALHAPNTAQLRGDVQRSLILRRLNDLLPPSGPVLNALNRVDPAPSIAGPTTPVAPPDPAIASDPDVRRVSRSVVRVLGTACGLGVEGSGWVAAPGLVVTNAHVLAGEDDTTVTTVDGASLDATPVRYDPANDLALLRIDAPIPALKIAPDPQRGTPGAILGYPENGPYAVSAARLGDTSTVTSEDSYGNGPIRRSISFLRGSVRSGNSGGPLVDSRGRVLATIFAATTSGPPGGFAVPNDVVQEALRANAASVDTGPCTG
ncbi:MAG TPA: MarP family serine protease [Solirubrobacterales bacterium]|nr:MarP family serine protease [Solirubrobacterales bacterium]